MSGITWHRAVDGHVHVAAADDTVVSCYDTGSKLAGRSNCTLHLQVLNNSTEASVLEESRIHVFWVHVDFNGMSLAIESTLIRFFSSTNHRTVDAPVNVCRQDSIGIDITIIHEYSELFQVSCRTDLIDAIHFGKRPRSCGDNAQQRSHTQIQ